MLTRVLFVCTENRYRSLTAETIFQTDSSIDARSAGTNPDARILISADLIRWAEIIAVMEEIHREIIEEKFKNLLCGKYLSVLNIPDVYAFMQLELIEKLQKSKKILLVNRKMKNES